MIIRGGKAVGGVEGRVLSQVHEKQFCVSRVTKQIVQLLNFNFGHVFT